MDKKSWEKALKSLEELHKTASKNEALAKAQREELEFNIENYKRKIKSLK